MKSKGRKLEGEKHGTHHNNPCNPSTNRLEGDRQQHRGHRLCIISVPSVPPTTPVQAAFLGPTPASWPLTPTFLAPNTPACPPHPTHTHLFRGDRWQHLRQRLCVIIRVHDTREYPGPKVLYHVEDGVPLRAPSRHDRVLRGGNAAAHRASAVQVELRDVGEGWGEGGVGWVGVGRGGAGGLRAADGGEPGEGSGGHRKAETVSREWCHEA